MKEVDQVISGIKVKIKKLIDQQQNDELQINQLKKEIKELNNLVVEQTQQIRTLEEKNRILTVTKTLESTSETNEVKKKITELVREIDKCISLLNK